ncbi:hypothetical protein BXY51_003248 [Actinoplanes cyaneus]|nr:hypothetical protein [Actinoplanes cyaneus]
MFEASPFQAQGLTTGAGTDLYNFFGTGHEASFQGLGACLS